MKFLLTIFLGLFLFGNTILKADFQKGLDAARSEDYLTAIKEWRPLAEQGDAYAQYYLGLMYDGGYGVEQNFRKAAQWFLLAAEQGITSAQFNLGFIYQMGRGVTIDHNEAEKWYLLVAEKGDIDAQYSLGILYFEADDNIRDIKKAFKWFSIAAEKKNSEAQYMIGVIYTAGYGVVEPSTVKALMWFNISASAGNERAKRSRDLSLTMLSETDIKKAKEKEKICVKNNYKGC